MSDWYHGQDWAVVDPDVPLPTGAQIAYVPWHCRNDELDPEFDCNGIEYGVVVADVSHRGGYLCLYWRPTSKIEDPDIRTTTTAEFTPVQSLIKIDTVEPQKAAEALKLYMARRK